MGSTWEPAVHGRSCSTLRGREAAAVSVPHEEMVMEQPLWAEQRPENWADASFEAIRGALAAAGITRRSGPRRRTFRADARAGDSRSRPPRHPSGAHLVRPAQPTTGGLDQSTSGRSEGAGAYGESGADWIYPAETVVGARSRAAKFRECAACSAAQGLRSFSTHGRTRHRGFRRVGNRNVRRRSPPLVLRNDGWFGPGPFHSSARV